MACIHYCSIIQNSFIALKNPLCSVIHWSLLSQLLATTDLFTVSMVLSFLECHIVGIIQYVAFSVGFFHLVTYI